MAPIARGFEANAARAAATRPDMGVSSTCNDHPSSAGLLAQRQREIHTVSSSAGGATIAGAGESDCLLNREGTAGGGFAAKAPNAAAAACVAFAWTAA
jgi:hypothetical protein